MRVDELYSDERRRASSEVSLGDDWTSDAIPLASYSLFWIEATGEVFGLRHGPIAYGPGAPKPAGVYRPVMRQTFPVDQEVSLLGSCTDFDRLSSMIESAPAPKTVEWLRERLAGR